MQSVEVVDTAIDGEFGHAGGHAQAMQSPDACAPFDAGNEPVPSPADAAVGPADASSDARGDAGPDMHLL